MLQDFGKRQGGQSCLKYQGAVVHCPFSRADCSLLACKRSFYNAHMSPATSSRIKISLFFLQSLSLQVVERGEDELAHTVELGRALRALTSLTSLKLDWKWRPGSSGSRYGTPNNDIAEAIALMPALRFVCSPLHACSRLNSAVSSSTCGENATQF